MIHSADGDNFSTNEILQTTIYNSFSGDPVSSATAHVTFMVVQAGILPVLTVCGVIMNVINMVVFLRQGLSDRINLCLFSLAVADTGYITMSMTRKLYSIFSIFDSTLAEYWQEKSLNMIGIYVGFLITSNCLTLLISLERCVCVLWPLKAKNLLSIRHIKVVIITIFITCFSCCSLACFQYNTVSYQDPLTNATRYYSQRTRFYLRNERIVDSIFDIFSMLCVPTMCMVGVMLATLLISLRMRSVLSWRIQSAHVGASQTVTSAENRENLVTQMLLVVCMVFTICTIPSVAHAFSRFFVVGFGPDRSYSNLFYFTISMLHMTATINSSVNFLIYWTMSTKFKDTFRGLIGRKLKTKAGKL